MPLRKRAPAFTFLAAVALVTLGPQAVAAPVPGRAGTVTVRRAPACYQ
ncbi:hypothetical protein HKX69_34080 [Streptomyces argyrophyllae]|uniref:Uncharacterized protein n=1 Tax=Streptomyces argyrophylli TaxID=2726118 RepID=A0A6M4PTD9_9ACTN|nr:hypothetical protein [Streptomyces argyrophyllae]QJS13899.1 hypothetical protein HKX69_34080 [Streptomyces argyrophyllae]